VSATMEKGFRQGKKSVSSRSSIVPIGVASAASPALEWVWAICKEIVEAHGGRIRAQNAAGWRRRVQIFFTYDGNGETGFMFK